MNSFLQAFSECLDEDATGVSTDESPASRVNVVLRSARRYVTAPEQEKAYFEKELDAFESGLEEALGELESLFEKSTESESILMEVAHASLQVLLDQVDALGRLLEQPSEQALDQIVEEMLVPTYRLLLARETLENLASVLPCPYCEAENAREAQRCDSCGKPLTVPDPLKQEGELIEVPPSITHFLQLCFSVARDPQEHQQAWQQHLTVLRGQFGAALPKVQEAGGREAEDSANRHEFEQMSRGLEVMLAGFDELESFANSQNAEVLDTGWVNMMSGYKIFKQAGDRLGRGQ